MRAPGLHKAAQWIRSFHLSHPHLPLPSVQRAADACGVSYATMWKAYHGYAAKAQTGNAASEQQPTEAPLLKWEQCLERLDSDIAGGLFGNRTVLPAVKVLQYRYQVNYKTIRKAIDRLAEQGLIIRKGASWHIVSEPRNAGVNDCIIYLSAGNRSGESRANTPYHFSNLRILERAAGRRQVRIEYMVYVPENRLFVPDLRTVTKRPVIGVICSDKSVSYEHLCDMVAAVPDRWPMVLVNEPDFTHMPPSLERRPNTAVCRLGSNMESGRQAVRYLEFRGHREIVFLSPVHGSSWSQNKLAGVLKYKGRTTSVHVETIDDFSFFDAYARQFDDVRQSVHDKLAALAAGDTGNWGSALIDALRRKIDDTVLESLVPLAWREMFERAYAHAGATAWICVNDDVALAALGFLALRKERGRGAVAVIGFDDHIESAAAGLTTFTFDHDLAMETTLELILSPRNTMVRGKRRIKVVSFSGHVIARRTA